MNNSPYGTVTLMKSTNHGVFLIATNSPASGLPVFETAIRYSGTEVSREKLIKATLEEYQSHHQSKRENEPSAQSVSSIACSESLIDESTGDLWLDD